MPKSTQQEGLHWQKWLGMVTVGCSLGTKWSVFEHMVGPEGAAAGSYQPAALPLPVLS